MHIEVPHHCGRTHRGFQSLAECIWPTAAYVIGDGPYALIAHCDMLSVALYATAAEAGEARRRLTAVGCGRTCEGQHQLAVLVDDPKLLMSSPSRRRGADSLNTS
jgi:hypothetical protein